MEDVFKIILEYLMEVLKSITENELIEHQFNTGYAIYMLIGPFILIAIIVLIEELINHLQTKKQNKKRQK